MRLSSGSGELNVQQRVRLGEFLASLHGRRVGLKSGGEHPAGVIGQLDATLGIDVGSSVPD